MAAIIASTTNTTPFKSSQTLQSKRYAVASVTKKIEGTNDPNEARYWTQKLGLGDQQYSTSRNRFAHPRSLTLKTKGGSALVHQVLFGPPAFSSSSPLAVVSGPRVSLYGTTPQSTFSRALSRHSIVKNNNIEHDRQVQTGGNLALCGAFRNDGRLIAVGTDVGEMRICDVTMRATLSTFRTSTKLPFRAVEWMRNGQQVFTGGDDAIARLWDIGSTEKNQASLELTGHGDAIRCIALWQVAKALEATFSYDWTCLGFTGSYDNTVRVWNLSQDEGLGGAEQAFRCLSVLNHGSPVEAISVVESTSDTTPIWLLSAGGTTVKVWNPLNGNCLHTISTRHRKTITTVLPIMRADKDSESKEKTFAPRILTASLDGILQFHAWNASDGMMSHLYSTKVADGVTSVAMDEGYDRIAIGVVSGEVIVRMRGPNVEQTKRRRDPPAGTFAFFQRGMNTAASNDDYMVSSEGKKRKLRSFDVALKQFRYGDALDDALATRRVRDVIAVLEELGRRRGLSIALSNRDEETLEPVLSFTIRYITKPAFSAVLVGVANLLVDLYGDVVGQSETIDELFVKLKRQVSADCKAQRATLRLLGQIDGLLARQE